MKYLFAGIIVGVFVGILFFMGTPASEIVPEFYSPLASLATAEVTAESKINEPFVVPMDGFTLLVDTSGNAVKKVEQLIFLSYGQNASLKIHMPYKC